MRNLRMLALLAVACATTGCLRISYTLNIKPDGSGTIAKTVAASGAFADQASAMGTSLVPTEAKLKEDAAGMGAGVRLVSSVPYKAGGFEGITATYAFDDVTKLAVNMEQAVTGAVSMPGINPNETPDPDAEVKLTFTREGANSVLVMKMPDVPEPDADTKKQAEQAAQQAEANPAMEAMMKQMLAGMHMEIAVNVQGQIVKTNAPYVEGSKVVLMRLDGDELIKSGKGAGQLFDISRGADVRTLLTKIPGLKVVLLPEVRIEFK